ncbi:alpha-ribazole phosphatase [Hydrogenoanaerobacterium saccharovorans]|uniref:Alpha-ribazole phosphatase n=1 Tax=Hydrogenoanaerobacterium saccharovorans TaxID=474960 RepID=A0A1H8ABT0_9FIRM|nr:histidine phosphatase family protein [Hydrogenoanaerobacterium saccharovorans]RPF48078.1 alpha-ribazole phosphatase [Hydrogenoanaerobacterium saccharovorans]SEM67268.1 alpha-ribazole phosphatase [Hydrogenoanaerobacterium saccharovorans]
MITYKIHFIRHGITEGNLKGLYVGRTDTPLCDDGRKKLLDLKENCGYPDIQKLYVSPLTRCRETAEIIYPDSFTEIVQNFTEYDFGAFEGKAISELKTDPAFNAWIDSGMKTPPPGGESSTDLEQRISDALEYVFENMMKNKLTSVGVITHGGVIMTLMAKYAYPKREKPYDWIVPNGTGFTILMTPQMWMRDEGFEVYEPIPYRYQAFQRLGLEAYQEQLREWNEGGFADDHYLYDYADEKEDENATMVTPRQ